MVHTVSTAKFADTDVTELDETDPIVEEVTQGTRELLRVQKQRARFLKSGGKSGITDEFGRPTIVQEAQADDSLTQSQENAALAAAPQAISGRLRFVLAHYSLTMRIKLRARPIAQSVTARGAAKDGWQRTMIRETAGEQVLVAQGSLRVPESAQASDLIPANPAEFTEQPTAASISQILRWLSHRSENFSLIANFWLVESQRQILRRL